MTKTILVTGGAGFIGSHLCERLLGEGNRVVAVDSLSDYYSPEQKVNNMVSFRSHPNFVFEKLDIRHLGQLRTVFTRNQFDAVVHLAGEVGVRPSLTRPADYVTVNIGGAVNVLELIKEHGVAQLVFGSSSSVYGSRKDGEGFMETDLSAPISPYAATKVGAESMCQAYAYNYGIKITVLRFFTVYGPRNRPDMACYQFTAAIDNGGPVRLFGKNTKRDFTYVGDIVEGIIKAIQKPSGFEVFNLGSSHPKTIAELVKIIAGALDKNVKIIWDTLPPSDMPITYANTDKARKFLGWTPRTDLQTGINNLVAWYQTNSAL